MGKFYMFTSIFGKAACCCEARILGYNHTNLRLGLRSTEKPSWKPILTKRLCSGASGAKTLSSLFVGQCNL